MPGIVRRPLAVSREHALVHGIPSSATKYAMTLDSGDTPEGIVTLDGYFVYPASHLPVDDLRRYTSTYGFVATPVGNRKPFRVRRLRRRREQAMAMTALREYARS